jgi:hypothetical protein
MLTLEQLSRFPLYATTLSLIAPNQSGVLLFVFATLRTQPLCLLGRHCMLEPVHQPIEMFSCIFLWDHLRSVSLVDYKFYDFEVLL